MIEKFIRRLYAKYTWECAHIYIGTVMENKSKYQYNWKHSSLVNVQSIDICLTSM